MRHLPPATQGSVALPVVLPPPPARHPVETASTERTRMFLHRLDIQGFKSFVDKTQLLFGDGITGVIGPNGCGKTNVSDAIRWVMGEQSAKQLRGDSMEDVIFNGCPTRKPLGMAEVHLTFKNDRGILPTEFSEVTISRRVFRSGMSEYFINKTPCRLRDIRDLF